MSELVFHSWGIDYSTTILSSDLTPCVICNASTQNGLSYLSRVQFQLKSYAYHKLLSEVTSNMLMLITSVAL